MSIIDLSLGIVRTIVHVHQNHNATAPTSPSSSTNSNNPPASQSNAPQDSSSAASTQGTAPTDAGPQAATAGASSEGTAATSDDGTYAPQTTSADAATGSDTSDQNASATLPGSVFPAAAANSNGSDAEIDQERELAQQVAASLTLLSSFGIPNGGQTIADVLGKAQKAFAQKANNQTSADVSKSENTKSAVAPSAGPDLSRVHAAYGLSLDDTHAPA